MAESDDGFYEIVLDGDPQPGGQDTPPGLPEGAPAPGPVEGGPPPLFGRSPGCPGDTAPEVDPAPAPVAAGDSATSGVPGSPMRMPDPNWCWRMPHWRLASDDKWHTGCMRCGARWATMEAEDLGPDCPVCKGPWLLVRECSERAALTTPFYGPKPPGWRGRIFDPADGYEHWDPAPAQATGSPADVPVPDTPPGSRAGSPSRMHQSCSPAMHYPAPPQPARPTPLPGDRQQVPVPDGVCTPPGYVVCYCAKHNTYYYCPENPLSVTGTVWVLDGYLSADCVMRGPTHGHPRGPPSASNRSHSKQAELERQQHARRPARVAEQRNREEEEARVRQARAATTQAPGSAHHMRNPKAGDWECTQCGRHNYASNADCYRCRFRREDVPPEFMEPLRAGQLYCQNCHGLITRRHRGTCKRCPHLGQQRFDVEGAEGRPPRELLHNWLRAVLRPEDFIHHRRQSPPPMECLVEFAGDHGDMGAPVRRLETMAVSQHWSSHFFPLDHQYLCNAVRGARDYLDQPMFYCWRTANLDLPPMGFCLMPYWLSPYMETDGRLASGRRPWGLPRPMFQEYEHARWINPYPQVTLPTETAAERPGGPEPPAARPDAGNPWHEYVERLERIRQRDQPRASTAGAPPPHRPPGAWQSPPGPMPAADPGATATHVPHAPPTAPAATGPGSALPGPAAPATATGCTPGMQPPRPPSPQQEALPPAGEDLVWRRPHPNLVFRDWWHAGCKVCGLRWYEDTEPRGFACTRCPPGPWVTLREELDETEWFKIPASMQHAFGTDPEFWTWRLPHPSLTHEGDWYAGCTLCGRTWSNPGSPKGGVCPDCETGPWVVLKYELDETRWFKGPEPTAQPAAPTADAQTPLPEEDTDVAGAAHAGEEEPASGSGGLGSAPQQAPPHPPEEPDSAPPEPTPVASSAAQDAPTCLESEIPDAQPQPDRDWREDIPPPPPGPPPQTQPPPPGPPPPPASAPLPHGAPGAPAGTNWVHLGHGRWWTDKPNRDLWLQGQEDAAGRDLGDTSLPGLANDPEQVLDFPHPENPLPLDNVGQLMVYPLPVETRGCPQPRTRVLDVLSPTECPQVRGPRPDIRYWLHRPQGGHVRVADRGTQTPHMPAFLPSFRQLQWVELTLQARAVADPEADAMAADVRRFRNTFAELIQRDALAARIGEAYPRGWFLVPGIHLRPPPVLVAERTGTEPWVAGEQHMEEGWEEQF